MNNKSLLVAIVTLAVGLIYLTAKMVPASQKGPMNLAAFGKLPCQADGRQKPYDTLARNTMMMVSDRQAWYDDEGDKQPAVRWLLDVMAGRPEAYEAKVFRIVNIDVLSTLGLSPRLETKYKFRYSLNEFSEKVPKIAERAEAAKQKAKSGGQLDAYERKVLELAEHIQLFITLSQWQSPQAVAPLKEGGAWNSLFDTFAARVNFTTPDQKFRLAQLLSSTKGKVLESMMQDEDASVRATAAILHAYAVDDAATFNGEVSKYQSQLSLAFANTGDKASRFTNKVEVAIYAVVIIALIALSLRCTPRQKIALLFVGVLITAKAVAVLVGMGKSLDARMAIEVGFNHFEPFYQGMLLYVAAFVLVIVGMLKWNVSLNRAALWLAILTLVVHTGALILRMYLQGRPPVTNLYSSAIFIGWGGVLLTLILEWFYRNGIGTMMAAIMGFLTLLIAHNLASDGQDTMQMMEAVLDTNFWLATHVTTVTFGYMATFVAGFLGLLYVILGVLTPNITPALNKQFGTMIYATICFAILLSFVGTVLGGIWADQSWGRFWGWDPKENGALMIVIWNALILHARWGGLVRQRGIALLAIFGNIITAWSWFGVNMLGAGLHSYGFMEKAVPWLLAFVASQLGFIVMGLLPMSRWASFSHTHKPDTEHSPDALPAS